MGLSPMMKGLEKKMMQRTVRFSANAAITLLLSVAILIPAARFNVVQAQDDSLACGKELINQCNGVPGKQTTC